MPADGSVLSGRRTQSTTSQLPPPVELPTRTPADILQLRRRWEDTSLLSSASLQMLDEREGRLAAPPLSSRSPRVPMLPPITPRGKKKRRMSRKESHEFEFDDSGTISQRLISKGTTNHVHDINLWSRIIGTPRGQSDEDGSKRGRRCWRYRGSTSALIGSVTFFLVITCVAIFGGVAIATTHRGSEMAAAEIVAVVGRSVAGIIDDIMSHTVRVSASTSAMALLANVSVGDTTAVIPLLYTQFETEAGIDEPSLIYLGDAEGHFCAVGRVVAERPFIVLAVNTTSYPFFTQHALNTSCPFYDASCPLADYSRPLADPTDAFSTTDRPWYRLAVAAAGAPVFSPVYLYFNPPVLGLTVSRLVDAVGAPAARVAAVDITLSGIGDLLERVLTAAAGGATDAGMIFIVDGGGYLVAASHRTVAVQRTAADGCDSGCEDGVCCRVAANKSDAPMVAAAYALYEAHCGELTAERPTCAYEDGATALSVTRVEIAPGVAWKEFVVLTPAVLLSEYAYTQRIVLPVILVGALIVGLVASVAIARVIARPINLVSRTLHHLMTNTDASREGRALGKTVLVVDEVLRIMGAVDSLEAGLRSFSKYVPQNIVNLLISQHREAILGVDATHITILFASIVGFEDLVASIEPSDVVDLIDLFTGQLYQLITAAGGTVDKFMGDTVMAFWNAPLPVHQHYRVAAGLALRIQSHLDELFNEFRETLLLPRLRVRTALHTGSCLVGNLGAPDRFAFTAVGDNVNITSRLHGITAQYKVPLVVSDAMRDRVRHWFLLRPLDRVIVKGRTGAFTIYELVAGAKAATPEQVDRVELFARAYDLFRSSEFAAAAELFAEYIARCDGEDVAATRHLATCRAFVQEGGAPVDWTGENHLMSK